MFESVIAGSLTKPPWLAETQKLWPQWQQQGDDLVQAKKDATLPWIKLQEDAGLNVIQFDEPAFNVYLEDAASCGLEALERAARGLACTTAVHICYGYGIQANLGWTQTLGDEWRQYEAVFPALAKTSIQQVSLACYHSHVPPRMMALLEGNDVTLGVMDVASDVVETREQVADTIGLAWQFVPKGRLFPCTN